MGLPSDEWYAEGDLMRSVFLTNVRREDAAQMGLEGMGFSPPKKWENQAEYPEIAVLGGKRNDKPQDVYGFLGLQVWRHVHV